MKSQGSNGNGKHGEGWRDARLDLSSHVAVVTGGARGIGRATCIALARNGIKAVAVVDVSEGVSELAAEANEWLGRPAMLPFRGDVTDSGFRRAVFAELERQFGVVSICIPAAGITRDRLAVRLNKETNQIEIYPEDDFRRVIEIDLTAPIYWAMETIASVARARLARGLKRWEGTLEPTQGAIVLIGSVSSTGNRGQISYASAKAGLEGAAGTLSSEASYYGVRCAILHPGYTDTAMVRALGEDFIERNILPQTRLHRLIQPEEIADAILFMIRNSAVSGELWADAGWHPVA